MEQAIMNKMKEKKKPESLSKETGDKKKNQMQILLLKSTIKKILKPMDKLNSIMEETEESVNSNIKQYKLPNL